MIFQVGVIKDAATKLFLREMIFQEGVIKDAATKLFLREMIFQEGVIKGAPRSSPRVLDGRAMGNFLRPWKPVGGGLLVLVMMRQPTAGKQEIERRRVSV
ncbi:hypothetical protein DSO57_1022544 [Entomophthora muscae]|uniref:Uncharacterized protein n=1 Tax=Entomophthora muscae TaxID=34485 RepID=A0ACC2TQQ1_9FUNG|nr:hypothetical protein DSO57_1022544 [Entomophthora muscae]